MHCRISTIVAVASLACLSASASAQTSPQRLRGQVESVNGNELTVKSDSGQRVAVKLADKLSITTRAPAHLDAIAQGAFIGTTAIPQPDGTLSAVEVHVFPESMRGMGEGHRPMDRQPGSTMTNATVTSIAPASKSSTRSAMTNATITKVAPAKGTRRVTLKYKEGEQTVVIPDSVPVTMMGLADKSALVPGAHVAITASKQLDGEPVAERITVGKDGYIPPL